MMDLKDIQSEFTTIKNRPIPKDPLNFFKFANKARIFLTITDEVGIWKNDLQICERLFGDMIICPFNSNPEVHKKELENVQEILKQRTKYPGIKENPELFEIAKTWILPTKLTLGPDAKTFLYPGENNAISMLSPIFNKLSSEPVIHFLKIEVSEGSERQLLYSILDSGFRPSLILVKWKYDLDEHIATAHSAGYLIASGYTLVSLENGYALYHFRDTPLFDICSMKTISITNPILDTIIDSFNSKIEQEKSKESSINTTAPLEAD
jgi:hypothetical protein